MILNYRETTFFFCPETFQATGQKDTTTKAKKNEPAAVAAGRVEIAELWGVGIL